MNDIFLRKKDFNKRGYMNIKNNGHNIYYIVNEKTSLQAPNILFNNQLETDDIFSKEVRIENLLIQMEIVKDKYFILKIENKFFIFDIKRLAEYYGDNLSFSQITEKTVLMTNFSKLIDKIFNHKMNILIQEMQVFLKKI